ncbi:MAG: hypothetical protein EOO28_02120 [Comamonadaceae bacterium]|nr:MAG: hypothetical protein EOO28_02120 [Comamonadaceae bacterium]
MNIPSLPPLTDLFALFGVNLVLCAALLRLLQASMGWPWAKWLAVGLFVLLWMPAGSAHLPLVAYVRGITSDFSVTLVLLATIGILQRWTGRVVFGAREKHAAYAVLAVGAVALYPLAMGWGDHDPYRAGWGSAALWTLLLALTVASWIRGLRLLPLLVAAGLLSWSAGMMESTNLFDYLLDPWIAVGALAVSVRRLAGFVLRSDGMRSGRRGDPGAGKIQ